MLLMPRIMLVLMSGVAVVDEVLMAGVAVVVEVQVILVLMSGVAVVNEMMMAFAAVVVEVQVMLVLMSGVAVVNEMLMSGVAVVDEVLLADVGMEDEVLLMLMMVLFNGGDGRTNKCLFFQFTLQDKKRPLLFANKTLVHSEPMLILQRANIRILKE